MRRGRGWLFAITSKAVHACSRGSRIAPWNGSLPGKWRSGSYPRSNGSKRCGAHIGHDKPRFAENRVFRGTPRGVMVKPLHGESAGVPARERYAQPVAMPAGRSRCRIAHYGLGLEELLEPFRAPFAAVAGLAVAAEWSSEVNGGAVDVHHASAKPSGHAARMLDAAAEHVTGQTVGCVVRDLDGFFFILVRDHHEHGTEDLFAGDGHAVVDVREDGRLDVVALVKPGRPAHPADDDGCAFVDALADESLHLLELVLVGKRAHHCGLGLRIAD